MTEHKFTDDEIIRALECCSNTDRITECGVCPYYRKGCLDKVHVDATNLVNRQKAEIERLEDKVKRLQESIRLMLNYDDGDERIKSEAIKEFAERLKEKIRVMDRIIIYGEDIDNLVEEMTEGKE